MTNVKTESDEFEATTADENVTFHSSIESWSRIREGINAYISYKILTKEYLGDKEVAQYSTQRRFNDFVNLHDSIVHKYGHSGYFIPPKPQKDFIGNKKASLSKSDGKEAAANDFIEKRKLILERYLNRLGRHSTLNKDLSFLEFIESDLEYVQNSVLSTGEDKSRSSRLIIPPISSPAYLLGKAYGLVSGTLSKLKPSKSVDTDENDYFRELANQIDAHSGIYRNLLKLFTELSVCRKDYINNLEKLQLSLELQSTSEENTILCHCLTFTAETMAKLKLQNEDLLEYEQNILSEYARDYCGYFDNIKSALVERKSIRFAISEQIRRSSSGSADPTLREKLTHISSTIQNELGVFDVERCEDFTNTMVSYLEAYRRFYLNTRDLWSDLSGSILDMMYTSSSRIQDSAADSSY